MYVPEWFQPYELVPEEIYNEFINDGVLSLNFWNLFDDRILKTADRIRNRYRCTVVANDWYWGGQNQYRVLRPPHIGIGAKWSQHRYARGFDCIVVGHDSEDIRKDILANPNDPDFEFITGLELGIIWLHIDTRNWSKKDNGIFTFTQ